MLCTLEKILYFLVLVACFLLTQVASPVVAEPQSITNEAVILSDRFENDPESGEYIFLGDGNIYFKYADKFEISEAVGIGLSYHNECMQFDIGFEQYIDETADKRSINELTFMVKLGSFGSTGTSSCS